MLFIRFEAISRKLTKKFTLKSKKCLSERSQELSRKLFFLKEFEKRQILRNGFGLMETIFFGPPSNGTNNTENSFAPQNEPHTEKNNFSGVLKHFRGN